MSTSGKTRIYKTERALTRTIRVAYPAGRGRMVLRTEQDWDANLEPVAVSDDTTVSTFQLEADQPFLYFKPRASRIRISTVPKRGGSPSA